MIRIRDLVKAYARKIVVEIPELNIDQGEFLGIVGNNGAGKTTLLRLILDLIKANKGQITSGKHVVAGSDQWKEYTASYLDESFLIDFLTPEEFFYFIGSTYELKPSDVDEKLSTYQSFFNNEILGQNKKYIRDFSKGNKQKIGICSALFTNPNVLLLDEPFDGLDPSSQIELKRILSDYHKKFNATIILSSHDLAYVSEITERIIVLEQGIVVRDLSNNEFTLKELLDYFTAQRQ